MFKVHNLSAIKYQWAVGSVPGLYMVLVTLPLIIKPLQPNPLHPVTDSFLFGMRAEQATACGTAV